MTSATSALEREGLEHRLMPSDAYRKADGRPYALIDLPDGRPTGLYYRELASAYIPQMDATNYGAVYGVERI